MDINKLGIRLMRKDDLMPITAASRCARSPENFQPNFKQIHLSSTVKRIISMAVDITGLDWQFIFAFINLVFLQILKVFVFYAKNVRVFICFVSAVLANC